MITKAPRITKKNFKDTHPIIETYCDILYLKQLYRQGWLYKDIPSRRCESVAEHTFGVAVTAMLLSGPEFPDLDMQKVLKMCLIHDFGEIFAGDFVPDDQISPEQKYSLEKESVNKIFNTLPDGDDYLSLWEEFEAGGTPEAQFVRQIDKLEMALQALAYEQQGFEGLDDFYESAAKALPNPQLMAILDQIRSLK